MPQISSSHPTSLKYFIRIIIILTYNLTIQLFCFILFLKVCCAVPLLDMRRYHKLLAGNSWMAEYGDPDTEVLYGNQIILFLFFFFFLFLFFYFIPFFFFFFFPVYLSFRPKLYVLYIIIKQSCQKKLYIYLKLGNLHKRIYCSF